MTLLPRPMAIPVILPFVLFVLSFSILGVPTPDVPRASAPAVTIGADRLFGEYAHLIRGKRLALVSNHSGRLADGTHLADALYSYRDAKLVALFCM